MEVEFKGAAKTVTGSKTILSFNTTSFLIDCGMYQGPKDISKLNQSVDVQAFEGIHNIFITHAHYDHVGYLPYLFNEGIQATIYCTSLTKTLIEVILNDSLSIQEYNLKKKKINSVGFDAEDIEKIMDSIKIINYEKPFNVNGCHIIFYPAGHILGAASILFNYQGKSVLFSGDLGRDSDLIHCPPKLPQSVNSLIIESTYGGRFHGEEDPMIALEGHVKRIIKTGGVLLVPSFAIARTQILMKLFVDLFTAKPDLRIPIMLDSPMAIKVTKIYKENCDSLKITINEFENILKQVKLIEYGNDVKKLKRKEGPYVLISSSGMISGGRVMNHFKTVAKDEKNTILLAGYQAEETIGRLLLEGVKSVFVDKDEVKVRAQIEKIDGISAHADHGELMKIIQGFEHLEKIFLNHGEIQASSALKESLDATGRYITTIAEENIVMDL